MVSLILLSHSRKVVEGIKDIAGEMARRTPIFIAGGDSEGGLGSNYDMIKDVIQQAYSPDGAVILFDLGSSAMTAEVVLDELEDAMKHSFKIVKAPLVEGAIVAAVEINSGSSLGDVLESLKDIEITK